jgi:hypothetical protein
MTYTKGEEEDADANAELHKRTSLTPIINKDKLTY